MSPKSEIDTPKWDDEHPRPFQPRPQGFSLKNGWGGKTIFSGKSPGDEVAPLSYGIPPSLTTGANGILWWELVALFFTSYKNDLVSQLGLSCIYSLVKKYIKAFFSCGLGGNVRHCCTLWFGSRFLNLFPYSVLSFCILDWTVSTHIKESINSLVELLQKKVHQRLKTSPFNLSTSTMPSMMRTWQRAEKFLPQQMRSFAAHLLVVPH